MDTVKVVVAYSPKLDEIGTVKEMSPDEARVAIRQGRVRKWVEGEDENPDVGSTPEETAAAADVPQPDVVAPSGTKRGKTAGDKPDSQ